MYNSERKKKNKSNNWIYRADVTVLSSMCVFFSTTKKLCMKNNVSISILTAEKVSPYSDAINAALSDRHMCSF